MKTTHRPTPAYTVNADEYKATIHTDGGIVIDCQPDDLDRIAKAVHTARTEARTLYPPQRPLGYIASRIAELCGGTVTEHDPPPPPPHGLVH